MPYNLPQPSTLDAIFQMNPAAFSQAQQFMGGGVQQNDADLQAQQLKNLFDQQNNPNRVQEQVLQNQQLETQLPGMRADASMKVRKNQADEELFPEHMKSMRAKFIKEASDADVAELENQAQKMAYSNDPAVRAQGEKLMLMHKDMVQDRSKQAAMQERQIALEKIRQTGMDNRADADRAAGKFNKKGALTREDQLEKALTSGAWDKVSSAYDYKAQVAASEGDTETAEFYAAKAKEYADKYVASRNNVKPGTVDLGNMPGRSIPTQQVPTTTSPLLPPNQIQKDLNAGAQFSSPEVEARVRARAGGGAKPAAQKAVSEAEYNALPKGATYLHPDGKMKVKR